MKSNCKHCLNSCKIIGKKECTKYSAIASQDFDKQKRDALMANDYKLAKQIESKSDYLNWGKR